MFRIHVGGKFKFGNLKKDDQKKITEKLQKKYSESGSLGIKIDNKQVSKDNIKDFEITKMKKIPKVIKPKVTKVKEKLKDKVPIKKKKEIKYKPTKKELETRADKIGFTKFRVWAKKEYKVTGRSVKGIISDILAGKKEVD